MLRLESKLRSSVNSSRPAIAGSAYGLICTALFCCRSLKDGYQVPSRPGRSRLAICLRCSSTFGAVLQADIRSAHAAMALYILEVLSLHQDANMRGWICVIEMECARHSVGSGSPTLRFVPGLKGCPTSKESGATPDASKAATNCNFRYLHRDSRSAVPNFPICLRSGIGNAGFRDHHLRRDASAVVLLNCKALCICRYES